MTLFLIVLKEIIIEGDDAYKLVRRILYVTNNLKTEEERNRENFVQQQQQGLNLRQALSNEVQIPSQ